MRKLFHVALASLLVTVACSKDEAPMAPQATGPKEIMLGSYWYTWEPTVEQPGLYDGTFSPGFLMNDSAGHSQIFAEVRFSRDDLGRTWEIASQDDHYSYDLAVAQLTDGKATSLTLQTCWMDRTGCLITNTTDDWALSPGQGVTKDPDLIGKTITRFVFTVEQMKFTPYTGLFDGTTVTTKWRIDIYGYNN